MQTEGSGEDADEEFAAQKAESRLSRCSGSCSGKLGKLALYQLSYRRARVLQPAS